MNVKN